MCLNKNDNKTHKNKRLFNVFSIQNSLEVGSSLSQLFLNVISGSPYKESPRKLNGILISRL
jgi:hypothetical protein